MRRLVTAAGVVLALIALITPSAVLAQAIHVYVDQQLVNFDVSPVMIQGRVLVPLRGIFERLGATVDYDAPTQHIVAIRAQQNVELTVGSRQAHVNGVPKLLDVPAFTINNRTMVPLRFISESLGADVRWDNATQTILIGSGMAGGPTAPPAGPAPAAGALSGRLVAVTTGQSPSIVVRRGGQDTTVSVTADTAIYRYNADTNAGGSAALGALRKGDAVAVQMDRSGQAAKITATLANGQSYGVQPDAQTGKWQAAQRAIAADGVVPVRHLGGPDPQRHAVRRNEHSGQHQPVTCDGVVVFGRQRESVGSSRPSAMPAATA